jgi:hypothetical protein
LAVGCWGSGEHVRWLAVGSWGRGELVRGSRMVKIRACKLDGERGRSFGIVSINLLLAFSDKN